MAHWSTSGSRCKCACCEQKGNPLLHFLIRDKVLHGELLSYSNHLLAQDVIINLRNNGGETPIHSFFRHGKTWPEGSSIRFAGFLGQTVSQFFTTKSDVDWHVRNEVSQDLGNVVASAPATGEFPWKVAQYANRAYEMLKMLLELGTNAGLEDQMARMPVDVAAGLRHEKILELSWE